MKTTPILNITAAAFLAWLRIAQATPQHSRHATLPPEMEAAVREAWQHDWTYDDDSYARIVKRYPTWESAIAALWVALDDEQWERCAPPAPPSIPRISLQQVIIIRRMCRAMRQPVPSLEHLSHVDADCLISKFLFPLCAALEKAQEVQA